MPVYKEKKSACFPFYFNDTKELNHQKPVTTLPLNTS